MDASKLRSAGLRAARFRYQTAMLAWLRHGEDLQALAEMQSALDDYGRSHPEGGEFWQQAAEVLAEVAGGRRPLDHQIRCLYGRVERELRRCESPGKLPDSALVSSIGLELRALRPEPSLPPALEALLNPGAPRLDPLHLEGWERAGRTYGAAWNGGVEGPPGLAALRQSLSGFYELAPVLGDEPFVTLINALGNTLDRLATLESQGIRNWPPAVLATLAAVSESLGDSQALLRPGWKDRVRHLVGRLEQLDPGERRRLPCGSSTAAGLFALEAGELIGGMDDALAQWPPDQETLILLGAELADTARQFDLPDLAELADEFSRALDFGHPNLEADINHRVASEAIHRFSLLVDEVAQGRWPDIEAASPVRQRVGLWLRPGRT